MTFHRTSLRLACLAVALAAAAATVTTTPPTTPRADTIHADHFLPSRPETVTWGWIRTDKAPVLQIQSGQTVRIDTISHHGSTQADHPVTFMGGFGVAPDEVLQDVVDFWLTRSSQPTGTGRGPHVVTGPIFVEGAEPGDMLEVQILDVEMRVPYGFNNAGPTSGVLGASYPGTLPSDPLPSGARKLIRYENIRGRDAARFDENITIEAAPFMGTMAVAPPVPVPGPPAGAPMQSSRPPGVFGGNLDNKDLVAGTTLYLPVFHQGALFYTGDGHSAQGDGEVDGTAVEHSLTPTLRFVVHKGKLISAPRAETATHYMVMGIDLDLDRALRIAVQEAVDFLVAEKGLTPGDAYAIVSVAADFRITEAVNLTQVVTGMIPKRIFDSRHFFQTP